MIRAIVYVSNTGSTKRYAEMLSEMTGIPAYPLDEAAKRLQNSAAEVFYMGWVRQGRVKDYAKAAARYSVAGVCGVGLSVEDGGNARALREKTPISDQRIKVFYARGGFDMNKLTGINKLMMGMVRRGMRSALAEEEKQGKAAEEVRAALDMLDNGADCVSEEKIQPAAEWIIKRNRLAEQALSEEQTKNQN